MSSIDYFFRNLSFKDRLHVRLRLLTIPSAKIARLIDSEGHFLDIGGGHGALSLYLAKTSNKRIFTVLDHDANKVTFAKKASQQSQFTRLSYMQGDISQLPTSFFYNFDHFLISDVLYVLPDKNISQLFKNIRGAIKPEGVLWIKDVAANNGLKSLWDNVQEKISTNIGLTKTSGVCRNLKPSLIAQLLLQNDFKCQSFPIDKGYLHAHILYKATPII